MIRLRFYSKRSPELVWNSRYIYSYDPTYLVVNKESSASVTDFCYRCILPWETLDIPSAICWLSRFPPPDAEPTFGCHTSHIFPICSAVLFCICWVVRLLTYLLHLLQLRNGCLAVVHILHLKGFVKPISRLELPMDILLTCWTLMSTELLSTYLFYSCNTSFHSVSCKVQNCIAVSN